MKPVQPAIVLHNLHRVLCVALVLSVAALGAALVDSSNLAVAGIVAALMLNIIATDRLRVVVANLRKAGR